MKLSFKEKYFHTVAIACTAGFLMGLTGVAEAGTRTQTDATVIKVMPKYKTTRISTPVNTCVEVDVPIYGSNGNTNSTGNTLMGAIIGGAIGNQIGNSKGNGAAGAVIGGLLGSQQKGQQNNTIVGYRKQNQCSTSYSHEDRNVFSHNVVIAEYANVTFQYNTSRQVTVGQTVPVMINITPLDR